MPFDAPSAHATFFRFLSVFFELRIWLFSCSFQPLYDLLFGALFIAVLNALLIALFIALFIVVCESLNGIRESFVNRFLGIIK